MAVVRTLRYEVVVGGEGERAEVMLRGEVERGTLRGEVK